MNRSCSAAGGRLTTDAGPTSTKKPRGEVQPARCCISPARPRVIPAWSRGRTMIRGRDLKLRDQCVVVSAHWDHFGIGAPDKNGDTIYNGALDNATGVASMLETARVLSTLPAAEKPRRSILFLITTAEEQGLLGSEWYSRHPLVPVAKTAANINLDSMNILGPTNDFVALGAERSSLNAVVWAIARERGNRISPDPRPEQGSFYRSDHFPFAKVGVPSISFKEGDDYIGRPKGWG